MSKRDRRDSDRRDDRRDSQPEQEQRPLGEDVQEGESLTALKAILAKVAALLKPLHLNPEESIRLVEKLYESVLEMDVALAGEADDTRKSSVLSHIQNAVIRRDGDQVVVEFSSQPPQAEAPAQAEDQGKGRAKGKAAKTEPAAEPKGDS